MWLSFIEKQRSPQQITHVHSFLVKIEGSRIVKDHALADKVVMRYLYSLGEASGSAAEEQGTCVVYSHLTIGESAREGFTLLHQPRYIYQIGVESQRCTCHKLSTLLYSKLEQSPIGINTYQ